MHSYYQNITILKFIIEKILIQSNGKYINEH